MWTYLAIMLIANLQWADWCLLPRFLILEMLAIGLAPSDRLKCVFPDNDRKCDANELEDT